MKSIRLILLPIPKGPVQEIIAPSGEVDSVMLLNICNQQGVLQSVLSSADIPMVFALYVILLRLR